MINIFQQFHLLFIWVTTIVSKIFGDKFQVIDTRWSCIWKCSNDRENRHVLQPSQYNRRITFDRATITSQPTDFNEIPNPMRKGDSVIWLPAKLWSLSTNYSDATSLHLTYHKFVTLPHFSKITASSETTRPSTCANRSNIINWWRFQQEGKGGDWFMWRTKVIIDYRPNGQPTPKLRFKI